MSASRNGVEPVEPAAVEGTGLPPNAAQLNAPFLCDLGLLIEEKAGRFKPTPVAMQFINTQITDEGRGQRVLRSIIEKTWFAATARTVRQTDPAVPLGDADLVAALRLASLAPAGLGEAPLRVLMEYLAYTGILVPSDLRSPGKNEKPMQLASTSPGPGSSAPVAPSMTPPELHRGSAGGPADAEAEWEVIQTGEFYLKIRPKPAVVKRLRKQLDLLDQRLREGSKLGRGR